jgi:hypothetical protein
MSTLIQHGKRRCDAQCYMSTTPIDRCRCVCGGMNHGIGEEAAIERTECFFRVQRDEAARMLTLCLKAQMNTKSKQLNLIQDA